jgi:hypothetical protein
VCAVVSVVREDLRHIFHKSDEELDVRDSVDLRYISKLASEDR